MAVWISVSTILLAISAIPSRTQTTVSSSYSAEFGALIGHLGGAEYSAAAGTVYAINETALQIVNFTWPGTVRDAFFWLDTNVRPTKEGVRLATFEYGLSPIGSYFESNTNTLSNSASESADVTRTVILLPAERKLTEFRSFSIFSLEDNISYGTVKIPENFVAPRTQILPDELQGSRYRISGVVQVVDTRTIRVIGFSYEGNKAPDGYFFVGRGLNVSRETGAKAAIRGRDTFDMILPMNERYTGGRDVYVELPPGYDIQHIDFLAIYSVRFDVVYASILLRNISRYSIPPHVPPQKSYEDSLNALTDDAWELSNLLGTSSQRNFTFQLGPSGGRRGYQAMHRVARPPAYVWYVNGYLANLYLKRGETYSFIVEGGRNATTGAFNNPLYLTNDSYGGYTKLSVAERQTVKIIAPEDPPAMASGSLCRWTPHGASRATAANSAKRKKVAGGVLDAFYLDESDVYATFTDFRATLRLVCEEEGGAAIFQFTPTADTPDQLYFQSYNNYQMGSRIFVVNEFPADLKHIVEEPFQYEAWRHQDNLELTREGSSSAIRTAILSLWPLAIATLLLPAF